MLNKRAQVWVETVLYLMIGLILIGTVLGFVMPKINAAKERRIVQQAIDMLNEIDSKIQSVQVSSYNRRVIEITLKEGRLNIYGEENKIVFYLDGLTSLYSERKIPIRIGNVLVLSDMDSKNKNVSLTLDYGGKIDITYEGKNTTKTFTAASIPHHLIIESKNPISIIDITSS